MKKLISLTELDRQQITEILETAMQMRKISASTFKKAPQLIGYTVGGVWQKPCFSSAAFSLAASYLSGTMHPFYGAEDAVAHSRLLDAMGVNAVVLSCENDNALRQFAQSARCYVINGGSQNAHPLAALADLMTLWLKADGLQNLTVLAVGNASNNKTTELNYCLQLFGSQFCRSLPAEDFTTPRNGIVISSAEAAFAGVDAVIDLGLAPFCDASRYYGTAGGISEKLMDKAAVQAPLLGADKVVDSVGAKPYAYSAQRTADSCAVAVAMALLYLASKG